MRRVWPYLLQLTATAAGAAPTAPTESPNVKAASLNAQLAVAYLKLNEIATAKDKIDKALTQNPRDPAVQVSAGLVYERLGDFGKADHFFAEALNLDPHNPDMINNYAVFLCRRGHYDKGEKLLEQVARNPAYATPEVAYTNAGVCARSAKNLPQAAELFRKALAIRPDYADALLQLADLSYADGAGLAARALLERYFKVGPETPESLLLAVRIESALSNPAGVDRYRKKLLQQFPESPQALELGTGTSGG